VRRNYEPQGECLRSRSLARRRRMAES
jgi:hypothetical protein